MGEPHTCLQNGSIKKLEDAVFGENGLKEIAVKQTVLIESLNSTLEKNNVVISAFNKFMIETQAREKQRKENETENKDEKRYKWGFFISAILAISAILTLVFTFLIK